MDFLGLGKKVFLRQAKSIITKAFDEGRIAFNEDKVEYTNKQGEKFVLGLDGMSAHLLGVMADFLTKKTGNEMATPSFVGVEPDDIKKILVKLKDKK